MASTCTCSVTGKRFEVGDNFEEVLRQIGVSNLALKGEPLPPPRVHPHEANRQTAAFGNHRFLFRTNSYVSGKTVLTRFDSELRTKVSTEEEFHETVDNTEVGRPYDFSRGFFEQWHELFLDCTHHPRNAANCEDSEYVNGAGGLKSCYLCFAAFNSTDCLYTWMISDCRDCVDVYSGRQSELCYNCINIARCYSVHDSRDCDDSSNLFGCMGCDSCQDCFGCVGLHRKQFHIFNQEVSKESYEEFLKAANLANYSNRKNALARCNGFWASTGFVENTVTNCANCTGYYLDRCEDSEFCFNCSTTRQSGYLFDGSNCTRSYIGVSKGSDLSYFSLSIDSAVNAYCYAVFGGRANMYSSYLFGGCTDCFGCSAISRKHYAILNREYSKEDYFDLVPRIISAMKFRGEWGMWFPLKYSPHYYNECAVDQYCEPIPLEEAARRGYNIRVERPIAAGADSIPASALPETLSNSDIIKFSSLAIGCERTARSFNYQKKELQFYLRNGIPLPRLHWRERMVDAITSRTLIPAV